MVERNLVNVLLLGGGFMLIFTSFQTLGNIEVGNWRRSGSGRRGGGGNAEHTEANWSKGEGTTIAAANCEHT